MHVAQDLLPWMENTPRPVALATGRVVRAIAPTERLDACIKAAEVVARFVAVASLASCAATRPAGAEPPKIGNFIGNLSFGVFDEAARAAASVPWDHPLRGPLRNCLRSAKRRKAIAGQRLVQFVELRNELGHAITPADHARARALLERDDPVGGLMELLEGLEEILAYPLLVLLEQEHRRGWFIGRFAFFAGEGEPIPRELELREPVYEWEVPYLCTPYGLLPLAPGLLYEPRKSDGRFGLYLLDGISADTLRYKSVEETASITRSDRLRDLGAWVQLPYGKIGPPSHPLLEVISCRDGRSLYAYLSGGDFPTSTKDIENVEGSGGESDPDTSGGVARFASIREFEEKLGNLGLGAAYRDIFYCLADGGAHAEVSGGGVRVVATREPMRVFTTLELTSADTLRVAVFTGALRSDSGEGVEEGDGAEEYVLRAGDSADELVHVLESAMAAAHRDTGPGAP